MKAAVAGQGQHGPLGRGQLGPDRHRQGAAQAAVADRHQPRARRGHRQQVVGGVHRLGRVPGDDPVVAAAPGRAPPAAAGSARSRAAGPAPRAPRRTAAAARPSTSPCPPAAADSPAAPPPAPEAWRRRRRAGATSGGPPAAELLGVDVDADQAAERQRLAQAPQLKVGELGAHQQRGVGLAQQIGDRREAERRPKAQRVVVGHRAPRVDRQADRRVERSRQRQRLGTGVPRAAAEQDQRALRARPAARRREPRRRGRHGAVGGRRGPGGQRRRALEHVGRDGDVDRARARGARTPDGPSEHVGQLVGILDRVAERGDLVHQRLLIGKVVDLAEVALAAGTAPEMTSIGIESW